MGAPKPGGIDCRAQAAATEEFQDLGPVIAAALISAHGNDAAYLNTVHSQAMAKMGNCACKEPPTPICASCKALLVLVSKIENKLEQLRGGT